MNIPNPFKKSAKENGPVGVLQKKGIKLTSYFSSSRSSTSTMLRWFFAQRVELISSTGGSVQISCHQVFCPVHHVHHVQPSHPSIHQHPSIPHSSATPQLASLCEKIIRVLVELCKVTAKEMDAQIPSRVPHLTCIWMSFPGADYSQVVPMYCPSIDQVVSSNAQVVTNLSLSIARVLFK